MPTELHGQERSGDAIVCAVIAGRIATGEVQESLKQPSGEIRSGLASARARAANLSSEHGTAGAIKAAARRWA